MEVGRTPLRRLWALVRGLPQEAALWRRIQEEPLSAKEKFGDAVVSIDQFVGAHKSKLTA